jgi:nitrogen fixation NifU-like protein
MSLNDLYQEMIIDHGRKPRNFGKLAKANHSHDGRNPLCGDKLTVYVYIENSTVQEVSFEGSGCAISVASASLMTEAVKGKTLNEIKNLFVHFHHLLTKDQTNEIDLGKLSALSGVAKFPMRVKCATLAWHTLNAALENNYFKPISTE